MSDGCPTEPFGRLTRSASRPMEGRWENGLAGLPGPREDKAAWAISGREPTGGFLRGR